VIVPRTTLHPLADQGATTTILRLSAKPRLTPPSAQVRHAAARSDSSRSTGTRK
jgi:hypothetical protein